MMYIVYTLKRVKPVKGGLCITSEISDDLAGALYNIYRIYVAAYKLPREREKER